MLKGCNSHRMDCGSTAISTKCSQKASTKGSPSNSSANARPSQQAARGIKKSPTGRPILKLENIKLKSPKNFSLKQHSQRNPVPHETK